MLPGVGEERSRPVIRCDSAFVLRRARRQAIFKEALQIALIAAVDIFFFRYPTLRLPLLSRPASIVVVLLASAALIGHIIASRKLPAIRARRIATTWSAAERRRAPR